MKTLACIKTRQSTQQLQAPAPDDETLNTILSAALNAPDHGLLRPWQVTVLTDKGLVKLGEHLVEAARLNAVKNNKPLTRAQEQHLAARPLRAPMIIVVACKGSPDHKIPIIEQQLSTGALIQNLQLALHALNFGCIWRTGEWAYHPYIKKQFNLGEHDLLAGFIYTGTLLLDDQKKNKTKTTPNMNEIVQFWH